jgi:hypothetical protein
MRNYDKLFLNVSMAICQHNQEEMLKLPAKADGFNTPKKRK